MCFYGTQCDFMTHNVLSWYTMYFMGQVYNVFYGMQICFQGSQDIQSVFMVMHLKCFHGIQYFFMVHYAFI